MTQITSRQDFASPYADPRSIFATAARLIMAPRRWLEDRRRRKQLVALLQYDDKMLEDMGLTRSAVLRASHLPLRVNAALMAREYARQDFKQTEAYRGRARGRQA